VRGKGNNKGGFLDEEGVRGEGMGIGGKGRVIKNNSRRGKRKETRRNPLPIKGG